MDSGYPLFLFSVLAFAFIFGDSQPELIPGQGLNTLLLRRGGREGYLPRLCERVCGILKHLRTINSHISLGSFNGPFDLSPTNDYIALADVLKLITSHLPPKSRDNDP